MFHGGPFYERHGDEEVYMGPHGGMPGIGAHHFDMEHMHHFDMAHMGDMRHHPGARHFETSGHRSKHPIDVEIGSGDDEYYTEDESEEEEMPHHMPAKVPKAHPPPPPAPKNPVKAPKAPKAVAPAPPQL